MYRRLPLELDSLVSTRVPPLGDPRQVTQCPQIKTEITVWTYRVVGRIIMKVLQGVICSYYVYFPISSSLWTHSNQPFNFSTPRKLLSSRSPTTYTFPTPVDNSQNSSNYTFQLSLTQLTTSSSLKHFFHLAFMTSPVLFPPLHWSLPRSPLCWLEQSLSNVSLLGWFRAPGAQPSHLFLTDSFLHKIPSSHMARWDYTIWLHHIILEDSYTQVFTWHFHLDT